MCTGVIRPLPCEGLAQEAILSRDCKHSSCHKGTSSQCFWEHFKSLVQKIHQTKWNHLAFGGGPSSITCHQSRLQNCHQICTPSHSPWGCGTPGVVQPGGVHPHGTTWPYLWDRWRRDVLSVRGSGGPAVSGPSFVGWVQRVGVKQRSLIHN